MRSPGLTYLCKAKDPKNPETKKEDRDAVTFNGYTDSGEQLHMPLPRHRVRDRPPVRPFCTPHACNLDQAESLQDCFASPASLTALRPLHDDVFTSLSACTPRTRVHWCTCPQCTSTPHSPLTSPSGHAPPIKHACVHLSVLA